MVCISKYVSVITSRAQPMSHPNPVLENKGDSPEVVRQLEGDLLQASGHREVSILKEPANG